MTLLLYSGAGDAVFLKEELLRVRDILNRDKTADQVRHIQQGVVLILPGFIQLVVLLILRFAVGHRVVFLLDGIQMLPKRMPLFAALVERFQRLFHIARRKLVQRASVVHRASVRLAVELKQRASESGLAAAGFTDQTKRFSLVNIERDAVVRLDEHALLFQREVLLEVADAKQHLLPLFI